MFELTELFFFLFFMCWNRGNYHISFCSLKSLSLLTDLKYLLKAFHIFCITIPECARAPGLPKRVHFSGCYHVRSSGSCTLLETPAGSICVPTKSFRDYLKGSLGHCCRSLRPQICPSSNLIKRERKKNRNEQTNKTTAETFKRDE